MKKLFRTLLFAAVIFFTAAPAETFAIGGKAKRYAKKMNMSYPKIGQNKPDSCGIKFDIDSLIIIVTDDESSKASSTPSYTYMFWINVKGKSTVKSAELDLTLMNCTGKTQTLTLEAKLNSKTGAYEASNTLPENTSCPWILVDENIVLTNICGYEVNAYAKDVLGKQAKFNVKTINVLQTKDASGSPSISAAFEVLLTGDDEVSGGAMAIYASDEKGNSKSDSIYPKLNSKTGMYQAEWQLGKEGFTIDSMHLILSSTEGKLAGFTGTGGTPIAIPNFVAMQYRQKREPVKPRIDNTSNDSCNTTFNLKEVDYETANAGGLYTMQFNFNFGNNSDAPTEVVMAAQLTNCNGQTMNIKLKMYYNAATNSYYCGNTIKQDKDCEWKLIYAEVGAYNPCSTLTWWGLDFSQLKANGTGTRNTASNTGQTQSAKLL